jgi:hypothetical protein
VATFLVVPPRELLEHAMSEFVQRLFPSVPTPMGLTDVLLAHVAAAAGASVYVIHREELPDDGPITNVLHEAFGAEPGDEVIEFGPPKSLSAATLRRSTIPNDLPISTRLA